MKRHLFVRNFVLLATCAAFTIGYIGKASAGAKISVADDKFLLVGLLLQPRLQFMQDGAAAAGGAADTISIDPFIKRTRIMVYGQYTKWVNFFVETDNPNLGMGGNWSGRTYIQDAYLEFNIHRALQVDVGMLLLPFSHHGMQGATSLNALAYHADLIKYPKGATSVWRDAGIMLRGSFWKDRFEYRFAVTNGVNAGTDLGDWDEDADGPDPRKALNPFDYPMLSARMTFNVFESEGGPGVGGMYFDGVYLKRKDNLLISPKKILSIGVSAMYQHKASYQAPDSNGNIARSDILGIAADVFADMPLNAKRTMALTGQVNWYYYNYGEGHATTGTGFLAELGYRYNCVGPVFSIDYYNVKGTDADKETGDTLGLYGGINWWMLGHNANVKFMFGGKKVKGGKFFTDDDGNDKFKLVGMIQTQVLF